MLKNILTIFILLILASCNPQNNLSEINIDGNQDYIYLNQPYKGHIKTSTFLETSNGKEADFHKPNSSFTYSAVGLASWYGHKDGFHGKKTANGDKYNKNSLTAAHRTLPMPSMVRVTNLSNGRSVILMVNDRGPVLKNRLIDISERAADLLGFKQQGLGKVRVEYLPKQTEELLYKLGLKCKSNDKKKECQTNKCTAEYFVQVGAFKNRSNANKLAVKLQNHGDINISKDRNSKLFKVVIGPFEVKEEAKKIVTAIQADHNQKAVILEMFK